MNENHRPFASDDAMEEDPLEDQMQESLEIDHAEATMTVDPTREPKFLNGRFGCITGDHTVPHAEHISLLRAAQHVARFWKDDGSCTLLRVRLSTGGGQLVKERQYCCEAQHWFAAIWRQSLFNVRQDIWISVAGAEGGGSPTAG